jgi:MFS family permease
MKFFQKEEWQLLWPFYIENVISTALFILLPFMVLYFNSIGLSLFKIGILLAIWPLFSLIFEIPTGAIADLYGRKFSVLLGYTLESLLLVTILFSNNFYYLCIIMALLGISQTFVSGAYDSWAVDLLKSNKKKELNKSFFAKKQSMLNMGFIVSGLIGVFFVARFGLGAIWVISAIGIMFTVFFLSFGKEDFNRNKSKKAKSKRGLFEQSKNSIKYSYKHHVLFYLLLAEFLLYFALTFQGLISWTPLLKSLNFPDYAFGYLWSLGSIFGIFSPLIAQKIIKKKNEKSLLIFAAFLFFIQSVLILFASNIIIAIILLMFLYGIMDFQSPIFSVFLHRHIPSKIRATVGSINGMLISLASILSLPLIGFLLEKIGPKSVIFICGLLMIPIIILYSRIREK